jgi:16S rRNA (adenine1518-N6/adenine1519-N6)-dimethyltransferase
MKTSHTFRKKWGQNFLQDPNIIKKIVAELSPTTDDVVIEIGPGEGALTFELAKTVKQVYAIEIDPLLVEKLKNNVPDNVQIIHADILDFDLSSLPHCTKIIGNLPYNITSPIIFKCLAWKQWQCMVFMTQKEVAQRITASHGNKVYGRLSVMAQVCAKIDLSFTVPRTVFYPQPNVDSAIISFLPQHSTIENIDSFGNLVKSAFSQRRKTLRNTLKGVISPDKMGEFATKRAEELSIEDFIHLYTLK